MEPQRSVFIRTSEANLSFCASQGKYLAGLAARAGADGVIRG
jgi:hypothetical protein